MSDAVIADLDGTLCDVSGILHHLEGEERNFAAFHAASADCPPAEAVVDAVRAAHADRRGILSSPAVNSSGATSRSTGWSRTRSPTTSWSCGSSATTGPTTSSRPRCSMSSRPRLGRLGGVGGPRRHRRAVGVARYHGSRRLSRTLDPDARTIRGEGGRVEQVATSASPARPRPQRARAPTVADECLRFRYEESADLLARMASRGEMDYAEVLATVHDILDGRLTVADARAVLLPDVLSSLARTHGRTDDAEQDFRDAADISRGRPDDRAASIRADLSDAPRIDGQANLTLGRYDYVAQHARRRPRRRHAMDPARGARAPGERTPWSQPRRLARGVQPAVRRPRAAADQPPRRPGSGLRTVGRRRSRRPGRR